MRGRDRGFNASDLRIAEVTKMDTTVENGKVSSFRIRVALSCPLLFPRVETTRKSRRGQFRDSGSFLFHRPTTGGLVASRASMLSALRSVPYNAKIMLG